jgi:hypothetical protein
VKVLKITKCQEPKFLFQALMYQWYVSPCISSLLCANVLLWISKHYVNQLLVLIAGLIDFIVSQYKGILKRNKKLRGCFRACLMKLFSGIESSYGIKTPSFKIISSKLKLSLSE